MKSGKKQEAGGGGGQPIVFAALAVPGNEGPPFRPRTIMVAELDSLPFVTAIKRFCSDASNRPDC
jgi:hypothetical protein